MSILIYILISLFIFILLNITLYYNMKYYIDSKKSERCINDYEKYIVLLGYYQDKSYEMIYKNNLLIYSLEGYKPSDEEFTDFTKEYCKLTLQLLGPKLTDELIFYYGDMETLILNITEQFNSRSEHDEIREATINNLMEKDNLES